MRHTIWEIENDSNTYAFTLGGNKMIKYGASSVKLRKVVIIFQKLAL
jgi:hypothetical protein